MFLDGVPTARGLALLYLLGWTGTTWTGDLDDRRAEHGTQPCEKPADALTPGLETATSCAQRQALALRQNLSTISLVACPERPDCLAVRLEKVGLSDPGSASGEWLLGGSAVARVD